MDQILAELKSLGSESYKKVLVKNHGVGEPCFGVKIADLKKIQKRVKKDRELALGLYETGNYDAMYLAGLIADDARMTRGELNSWVKKACGGALPGTTVPGVAAGNANGWALALEWIDSAKEHIAEAGWNTLSCIVSVKDDSELDPKELKSLLKRVAEDITKAPDRVRYAMNHFVIAVGCFVKELSSFAKETGNKIGPVTADLGNNQCSIPFAPDYIEKVEKRGTIGKKRKSAKC